MDRIEDGEHADEAADREDDGISEGSAEEHLRTVQRREDVRTDPETVKRREDVRTDPDGDTGKDTVGCRVRV